MVEEVNALVTSHIVILCAFDPQAMSTCESLEKVSTPQVELSISSEKRLSRISTAFYESDARSKIDTFPSMSTASKNSRGFHKPPLLNSSPSPLT